LGAAFQADGESEVRGDGPKHQKEKRSMDHFGGLDVSVKETSICIVDNAGRIVKEVKVTSEPAALLKVLENPTEGGLCNRGASSYILSSVFFIFGDLDLAIFFLLILSFDMSPFDMLSLWAAGPVVAGLFVSVD
jgi:hypothetical protein